MKYPTDIIQKITSDFGESGAYVVTLLDNGIQKTDIIKSDRIIRCILFLAGRDINKLEEYIESAIRDPRDVIFWAEYENREDITTAMRIRDFSRPFKKASENAKE